MLAFDRTHWFRSLITRPGSVGRRIAWRVTVFTALAVAVTAAHHADLSVEFPAWVFTTVGTVLGLLLAFRTNTGYERFWEGRRAWGTVINVSRNLVRQTEPLLDPGAHARVTLYVAAFAHALRHHLRGEPDYPELERLLGEDGARELLPAPGPTQRIPLEIGKVLTDAKKRGLIDGQDLLRIDANVSTLVDQVGVCERIQRTPIPIAYALHLRRLLFVFLATLPFALVDVIGWATPFVCTVVAYALLGIEQIGVEIENPFQRTANDIDVDGISDRIERDVAA